MLYDQEILRARTQAGAPEGCTGAADECLYHMRTLPTGWRDFKACRALLQKLLDDLLYTIPDNKFNSLVNKINRTRCEYRQGPAATVKQETDIVLDTGDAIALCYYAHDGRCKVCVKDSCKGCPLAYALDACLTLDRGDQMWSQIDITKRYEDVAEGESLSALLQSDKRSYGSELPQDHLSCMQGQEASTV